MHFSVVIFCTVVLFSLTVESSIQGGYIRSTDQNRFTNVLLDNIESKEASNVYYGLHGLKLLKKDISSDKKIVACKTLSTLLKSGNLNAETIFYISSSAHYLPACKNIMNEEHKILTDILSDGKYPISDLYYAVLSLVNLGKSIPNPENVAQKLQTLLKHEDSIINLGYTFHIASNLGSSGKFALDRIEEALVQADEIDGKLMQFEGGLSVTSLVLVGINKLYHSQNLPTTITNEQAEKFVSYLVSRRTVQTAKGIAFLIEAVRTFTDNPKLSPASIGLATSTQSTTVAVRVSDVLGNPLDLAADSVIAQSATRLGDDVVVLAKQKLIATSNPTIFNLELPRDRMAAGLYKVVISAGSHRASLTVTAQANGVISFMDIGVVDADQLSTAKLQQRLPYPSKLPNMLEAESQQVLLLKFAVVDSKTKKPLQIQQAFLKLTCAKTNSEIIFVADFENTSNLYKVQIDIDSKLAPLADKSKLFNLQLILGDTILNNPLIWDLGQFNVKISINSDEKASTSRPVLGPKPEIQHLFREPERRPPQTVSMFFTGLIVAPLILLFIIWIKLGVNVSNFKFSLSAIVFHLGLAGIFILYGIFWLSLNMFQTSRWLILLGAITFFSGNKLLRAIAEKRKN